MAYEFSRSVQSLILGHVDTAPGKVVRSLNSQFVAGTSGTVIVGGFFAPVGQSSGALTVHVFVNAVTGTPDDMRIIIWDTSTADPDRRQATAIATSAAQDWSGAAGTWVTVSFTGITLTAYEHYWIGVYNNKAAASSNYCDVVTRGAMDLGYAAARYYFGVRSGYHTAGWPTSSDLTSSGYAIPMVIKFDDGTLFGQPYVEELNHSSAPSAANTDDRGGRITPSEDIVVSGYRWGTVSSVADTVAIYKTDGTVVMSPVSIPYYGKQRAAALRFAPVTLFGGVTYDYVLKVSGGGTGGFKHIYMGESSPPADVTNCRLPDAAYVYGGTPGSYTVDQQRAVVGGLLVDDNPAQASGGPRIVVNRRRKVM